MIDARGQVEAKSAEQLEYEQWRARVAAMCERDRQKRKRYYDKHKTKFNKRHSEYRRRRHQKDPSAAAAAGVVQVMNAAIRQHKRGGLVSDKCKACRLLGCTWPAFVAHMEIRFTDGMTWANHGQRGWHLDHIRPLASFDLTDETQLLEACHFTNVQPLWAADNIAKGGRHS